MKTAEYAVIRVRTIIGNMPIKIPSGLPARDILDSERIFALEKPRRSVSASARSNW